RHVSHGDEHVRRVRLKGSGAASLVLADRVRAHRTRRAAQSRRSRPRRRRPRQGQRKVVDQDAERQSWRYGLTISHDVTKATNSFVYLRALRVFVADRRGSLLLRSLERDLLRASAAAVVHRELQVVAGKRAFVGLLELLSVAAFAHD